MNFPNVFIKFPDIYIYSDFSIHKVGWMIYIVVVVGSRSEYIQLHSV